jgi:hypothetical protein
MGGSSQTRKHHVSSMSLQTQADTPPKPGSTDGLGFVSYPGATDRR